MVYSNPKPNLYHKPIFYCFNLLHTISTCNILHTISTYNKLLTITINYLQSLPTIYYSKSLPTIYIHQWFPDLPKYSHDTTTVSKVMYRSSKGTGAKAISTHFEILFYCAEHVGAAEHGLAYHLLSLRFCGHHKLLSVAYRCRQRCMTPTYLPTDLCIDVGIGVSTIILKVGRIVFRTHKFFNWPSLTFRLTIDANT